MSLHVVCPVTQSVLLLYSRQLFWTKGTGDACKLVHLLAKSFPAEWFHWCWWLSAVSSSQGQHSSSAGISAWVTAAPSPPRDHETESLCSTPPPAGPLWTSDLRPITRKIKWMCGPDECTLYLSFYLTTRMQRESLTSPQSSNALLQPVGLDGITLSRILVNYRQVLIPVTPVNLVHPDYIKGPH